jgi:hypothetical protein
MGHVPPGVVVINAIDPAWTAGLALAAGRGQPLIVLEEPIALDHYYSVAQADDLAARIEAELAALGVSWNALGDDIDAVTLAMNCPVKIQRGDEFLATSDRIGRLGNGTELPQRWAWTGQVPGLAREAAYRAMSALFLTHDSAFFFDGYPNSKPWDAYDCTKAAQPLRDELKLNMEVIDTPRQGASDWRSRAVRPVDASVVYVTTKGNADFFDLEPGQCKPVDVPIFTQPFAAHIVHSWSAIYPGLPSLLSGKVLQRGAYFYVGSVHEPYLSAFLPTPMLTARMFSGAAWGAAVRQDGGPVWKVAVLGDPLVVYTSRRTASTDPLPLENAERGTLQVIGATLREDLKADRFEQGFRALLLTGRDDDLAKLASAALSQKRESITSAAAELSVLPLFRAGKHDDMLSMYTLLDKDRAASAPLRDALWLAAYPRFSTLAQEGNARWLSTLRLNVRPEVIARDATTLAAAVSRERGKDAGVQLLEQIRDSRTDKAERDAIDAALKQPITQWGL